MNPLRGEGRGGRRAGEGEGEGGIVESLRTARLVACRGMRRWRESNIISKVYSFVLGLKVRFSFCWSFLLHKLFILSYILSDWWDCVWENYSRRGLTGVISWNEEGEIGRKENREEEEFERILLI